MTGIWGRGGGFPFGQTVPGLWQWKGVYVHANACHLHTSFLWQSSWMDELNLSAVFSHPQHWQGEWVEPEQEPSLPLRALPEDRKQLYQSFLQLLPLFWSLPDGASVLKTICPEFLSGSLRMLLAPKTVYITQNTGAQLWFMIHHE